MARDAYFIILYSVKTYNGMSNVWQRLAKVCNANVVRYYT